MKHATTLAAGLALLSITTARSAPANVHQTGMAIDLSGMLYVFDTDPALIRGAIRVGDGNSFSDCVIAPDGRRGYVTDGLNHLWVVDLTSTPPQLAPGINPIAISTPSVDVAATADGRFLVVCGGNAGQPVSVVDTASRTELGTLSLGMSCSGVDVCGNGSVLVSSSGGSRVRRLVIDAAGHLSDTGESLVFDAPGNVYCAPGNGSGLVMSHDARLRTFLIPGLAPVSNRTLSAYSPSGAVAPDGTRFYARTFDGLDAFDFDQATGELGATQIFTATAGSSGLFNFTSVEQMGLDPDGSKLYSPERFKLDIVDAGSGAVLPALSMPDLSTSGGICLGPKTLSGCIVASCDDGNPCTDDVCGDAGCLHVPDDSNTCGDPLSCGEAHVCSGGACVSAGPVDCNAPRPPGFTEYFGGCRKIYEIGASSLDNLSDSCDGTGVDRFNCDDSAYGFHWMDVGGSGVGDVVGVDLTFVTGVNCAPGFSDARLNGVSVDRFDRDLDCTCSPAHDPERLFPPGEHYVKDGVNVISIVPSGSCEGLSASPLLDGWFARVTVIYAQNDPNCSDGSCNAATDRCDYTVIDCDDGNPCTIDTCDAQGACVYEPAPQYTDCSDGNYCSGIEYCDGGNCVSNGPLYCGGDGNPCTIDSCDPIFGCMYEPGPAGAPCDDGSSCTTNDVCDSYGSCAGRSPCDDGLPCTDDIADDSNGCACSHAASVPGTLCDDGIACTVNTTCNGTGGGASACTGGQTTCDDGNPCTDDSCDAVLGCTHANNTAPCDDFNACTSDDVCGGGSCRHAPVACDDGNPCTDDSCHLVAGCVHANNTLPCDDGNAGTQNDTCRAGVCTGSATCTSTNDPKTRGWYHSLCTSGGHSGDAITDADAACVAATSAAFAGLSTAAEVCEILGPGQHGNDPAGKAEMQLMTLALNICRHRVCPAQSLDATCSSAATVAQAFHAADATLLNPGHTNQELAVAECQAGEINNGHALRLDTLTLDREGSGVRLTWIAPTLDDGTGTPAGYEVWRRALGSLAPFTKIATSADPTHLDTTAANGDFEYEVTSVLN